MVQSVDSAKTQEQEEYKKASTQLDRLTEFIEKSVPISKKNYTQLTLEIYSDIIKNFYPDDSIEITDDMKANPKIFFDQLEKDRQLLLLKYGDDEDIEWENQDL